MSNPEDAENAWQMARVGFKAPPFWEDDPELWFFQVESQFVVSGITDDKTKFHKIVSVLDTRILASVRDIVQSPPSSEAYQALKGRVLDRFSRSEATRLRMLLQDLMLGDKKPSQLLMEMKNLAGTNITDDILRTLWLQRLPTNAQQILSVSSESLEGLAKVADKICEISNPVVIAGTSSEPNYDTLIKKITNLEEKLHRLTVRSKDRPNQRFRNRRSSSGKRQLDGEKGTGKHCWYHSKFGKEAKKCIKPCTWSEN